ncbi:hypothetical protein [Rhizorhabdus phycosphaerae]|uniref:hypothetical protein n=1 Tax=Rhizorhabdus phycosphaerae TaxID=2711156 RepID=UPI0013EB9FBD|nr:hypothetical protein [Rhizorhabdus phycosphaerae]
MMLDLVLRIVRWFGRRLLLYALLVAAIGFAAIALPWLRQQVEGDRQARLHHAALLDARRTLQPAVAGAAAQVSRRVDAARQGGLGAIDARIVEVEAQRQALDRRIAATPSSLILVAQGNDALLRAKRDQFDRLLAEQELAGLRAARAALLADRNMVATALDLQAQATALRQAQVACDQAQAARKSYEARWRWRWRAWLDNDEHRALVRAADGACADAARRQTLLDTRQAAARRAREARDGLTRTADDLAIATAERTRIWTAQFDAELATARAAWASSWSERLYLWADRLHLGRILTAAAWALLAIILTPYAIRLVFFFLLAPYAERRRSIALRSPSAGVSGAEPVAIPLPGPSSTSVAIRLDANEELLVRQDYLQSASLDGSKATRWLLDWRHPLSSLVTGLCFLTRITGAGALTTVSAVRDPLAEVLILDLPDGAGCVLQPRALAAVVHPAGRPLRITSHWRFFSLAAWLTLQLRYLQFHGPGRLILKGRRGIRVEAAEKGRIFGQAQLVGFSADLHYAVARTETFWPYFLGREPLFKDRVEGGAGLLIVEEAPLAGAGGGAPRHGLEGAADAALKLVGL